VVLVDASDSVLAQFGQEIIGVVQVITRTGWIPGDHISVIAFGGMQATLLCKQDCGNSLSLQELAAKRGSGATPLYDALVLAAQVMKQQRDPWARPVFILFSDGLDNISRNSFTDAVQSIFETETQVYAIDLNVSPPIAEGRRVLNSLAELTGGRVFPARFGAAKALDAVLDDLHAGYIVTYRLPDLGPGFHRVQIYPTHHADLQFRCRRGYEVGALH
jgi:Mg-chelatase subunit ChlD